MLQVIQRAAVCVAMLFVRAQVDAGIILAPNAVSANTMGTYNGDIAHTFDQSGLSVGCASGVTDFDAYVAGNPTHAVFSSSNAWAGLPGPVMGSIDYDLGLSITLESLALWTNRTASAITSLSVFVASNSGFDDATNVGLFAPSPTLSVQAFATTPATGRFVRLTVTSVNGGNFVNLAEVAFESATVPEPSSLALVGIGAGVIVFVTVCRRRE